MLLLLLPSCEKYVEGYDTSPNSPSDVSLEILLTGTELATINNYTGQLARLSSVLTQQQAGKLFQFEDFEQYVIRESAIDNEWNTIYNGGLINSKLLIEKAGDDYKYFRGIGRVLRAMNLGLATDLWGDVPNTEALKGLEGEANFNPKYDTQETILRDIRATLDAAIADFNSAPDDNLRVPGTSDLIFGGDIDKWRNAARVLKARYWNRESKRNAANSSTEALAALDAAFAAGLDGADDDMMAPFGEATNEWNQWYAFNDQRAGYMTMNNFFLGVLANDPRLPLYAAGTTDDDPIGPYYGSADSPLPLVTFYEAKFIEAEAALRGGNQPRALQAYKDGVIANLTKLGVADPTYVAAINAETSVDLQKIMTQKYIAMFTQIEVYNDWRRTGFPALTPNTSPVLNEIPRRLPTAQTERLYNSNAVVVSDPSELNKRVWWDAP